MDIKIGFTETPRELVIKSGESREDTVARLSEALNAESKIVQLDDEKGRTYLVNTSEVAYVEIGTSDARSVGFAGA